METETENSHSLVHCPNAHGSQHWAKAKVRGQELNSGFPWGSRDPAVSQGMKHQKARVKSRSQETITDIMLIPHDTSYFYLRILKKRIFFNVTGSREDLWDISEPRKRSSHQRLIQSSVATGGAVPLSCQLHGFGQLNCMIPWLLDGIVWLT